MEIWKDIPWYEWKYQASNLWRIKSEYKILKKVLMKNWYETITLYSNNKKNYRVNRLVMLTFKWRSDLQVNHKNWIKTDNRLENLEYVTASENLKHSYKYLWKVNIPIWAWKKWKDNFYSKKISQYLWNKFIKKFDCIKDAVTELWISHSSISQNLSWKNKTAWWFIFKYI